MNSTVKFGVGDLVLMETEERIRVPAIIEQLFPSDRRATDASVISFYGADLTKTFNRRCKDLRPFNFTEVQVDNPPINVFQKEFKHWKSAVYIARLIQHIELIDRVAFVKNVFIKILKKMKRNREILAIIDECHRLIGFNGYLLEVENKSKFDDELKNVYRTELMTERQFNDSHHGESEPDVNANYLVDEMAQLNDSINGETKLNICGICCKRARRLLKCITCPMTFHSSKCLHLKKPAQSHRVECEGCQNRRKLLRGDVVYAKLKEKKKWWPALVVSHPADERDDFYYIRFFGTEIRNWCRRSDVVLFNQIDNPMIETISGATINPEFTEAICLARHHRNRSRG